MWPSASTRRLKTTLRSGLGGFMIPQWCLEANQSAFGLWCRPVRLPSAPEPLQWGGRCQAPRCEMERSVKLAWQLTYEESEKQSLPVLSWQSCQLAAKIVIKETDGCRRCRGSHRRYKCVSLSFCLLLLLCREFLLFCSK